MSRTCPYCGAENAGVDPCPKCGGAVGVVSSSGQARFIEARRTFEWQPWALTLIALLLLSLLVGYRSKAKTAQASQNLVATTSGQRAGKIGGSALIDAPPSDRSDSSAALEPAAASLTSRPNPQSTNSSDQTIPTETLNPPQADTSQPAPDQASSIVQIGAAQVATEQDQDGNSFAVGHVTVVNTGPNEISNFTITMTTPDGTYTLVPFEGTIENAAVITNRRIPPGGYVDVPVMTEGVFQSSAPFGQKIINVSATENGIVATDSMTIQ